MPNGSVGAFWLVVMLALSVFPAHAKRAVERIVISGGDLAQPLEVVDADALGTSNPWGGAFAEWTGGASQPVGPVVIYDITLRARLHDNNPEEIYRFRYAVAADGSGHVYLPGRGEPWYRQNVSIILRNGQDGRWHPASGAWQAVMREAFAHK